MEDDQDVLSGLSSAAVPRKVYSYSQQLQGPSSPSVTNRKHQGRNHSVDDLSINPSSASNVVHNFNSPFSDEEEDDDDFFSQSSSCNPFAVSNECQPLPEFVGSGGNVAPFKAPARHSVNPGRPSCLELRPHPLRETQVGKFLRNIACIGSHLWAGQENGIRMWDLVNAYKAGRGLGSGKVRRGDEDAAPFHESSNLSPTICLLADEANKMVWSGHKDGKIRAWKNDQLLDSESPGYLKESLVWQAHKGPVLSIIISPHGDIWSGTEGGIIKIWPRESVEKSLNISAGEKRMAALLVERSGIDLRSNVTVNGTCSLSSSDVKHMISDNIKGKVWCAQSLYFSLWDARSKELIKVFNIDGQAENRADFPSSAQQEQSSEEETKLKNVSSSSKKEKSQGFLQRSRNAIIGAADAVRRVATRGAGAFAEDNKKTEVLVQSTDGMIWSGCSNGVLIQWDGNGNRLQEFQHHTHSVQCFCSLGDKIYVGYASGVIQVIDLEGNLVATWVAHSSPVLQMAYGHEYVFSLAATGGIRGWSITSPSSIDHVIRSELAEKEVGYAKLDSLRILVGTWNVGQGKPVHEALMSWLGSTTEDVEIVVVGLQEVEMGAGFLAMSAAKETVGLEGSAIGQLWVDAIGKALEEGTTFERMGSRQLAGLLISLWVRKSLRAYVGDVDAGAVACGFGRAIGNKGGVGLRIRVLDRIMCFVNCHLAAHLEAVNRRNADFDHIWQNMAFTKVSNIAVAAGVTASSTAVKGTTNAPNPTPEEPRRLDLAEADVVVFLGDFNYRLFGITYDEARDFVSQRCFDWLREKDQLRAEMKAGKVFQGMREAIITFPPTYKFERRHPGLGGYDAGEKKRIPAWCDRVIYRDNRVGTMTDCGLECPVVASPIQYEACMDVVESDHKPVRCKFFIKIAHIDRSVRREMFGEIVLSEKVQSLIKDQFFLPETFVNTNNIVLQNQDKSFFRINNRSLRGTAIFCILCQREEESDGRGGYGFPPWLEVSPAGGVIEPNNYVEISIRNEEFLTLEDLVDGIPQNLGLEDKKDKEVTLTVRVQGICSTEFRAHVIHVRHSFANKLIHPTSSSSFSLKHPT